MIGEKAGQQKPAQWGSGVSAARDEVLNGSQAAAGSGTHAGPRAWVCEQRSESGRGVDRKKWEAEM